MGEEVQPLLNSMKELKNLIKNYGLVKYLQFKKLKNNLKTYSLIHVYMI